jgi:hypothetical protein
LNRNLEFNEVQRKSPLRIGGKRRRENKYGPLAAGFYRNYLNGHADKSFGIRYDDGKPMIGDKLIDIVGDNIVIDDEVYIGTPGLWSLITDKTPKDYDDNDYGRYKELLHETNTLYHHYDPHSNYPRASKSRKWNAILRPIWDEFQLAGYEDDTDDTISGYQTAGEGIVYHPIKGCRIYLQKNGRCFNVRAGGRGMHLSPRPMLAGISGDGLYLRTGSNVYDGKGLLLGPHSPFRNIPILKWIL